jgi:outer membrane cobalamin receptor
VNSSWKTNVTGGSIKIAAELEHVLAGAAMKILTSEHSGTGEELPYTPAVSTSGYLGYRGVFRKGDLGITLLLDGRYVGERSSEEGIQLPAYPLLNGCAEVRIIDARLYYRVENLLDEEYESILGFPAPGRTFFYGLEWDFWN